MSKYKGIDQHFGKWLQLIFFHLWFCEENKLKQISSTYNKVTGDSVWNRYGYLPQNNIKIKTWIWNTEPKTADLCNLQLCLDDRFKIFRRENCRGSKGENIRGRQWVGKMSKKYRKFLLMKNTSIYCIKTAK